MLSLLVIALNLRKGNLLIFTVHIKQRARPKDVNNAIATIVI
jgi:hypothetical protein